ncbi:hypothetical protein P0Y35_11660 [Kiritimatiellaeota bacterium B1221]|nr:hypothetical protein [Kiritimatiellaeota bacterium B1221]
MKAKSKKRLTFKERIENLIYVDSVDAGEFISYEGEHPIFIYLKEGYATIKEAPASEGNKIITAYSWKQAIRNVKEYAVEMTEADKEKYKEFINGIKDKTKTSHNSNKGNTMAVQAYNKDRSKAEAKDIYKEGDKVTWDGTRAPRFDSTLPFRFVAVEGEKNTYILTKDETKTVTKNASGKKKTTRKRKAKTLTGAQAFAEIKETVNKLPSVEAVKDLLDLLDPTGKLKITLLSDRATAIIDSEKDDKVQELMDLLGVSKTKAESIYNDATKK